MSGTERTRNPKYQDDWDDFLTAEERQFLLHELQFSSPQTVATTATFAFLFQWPSYFCDESINSGWEVLTRLSQKPTFSMLLEAYPKKREEIEAYYPTKFNQFLENKLPFNKRQRSELLVRFQSLLQDLWDRSYQKIWKQAKKDFEVMVQKLQTTYFQERNFIEGWEKVTGLSYPYSTFSVIPLDSVKYLGTSLLAERDCFSFCVSEESIYRIIVHEIGTHTLIQRSTLLGKDWRPLLPWGLNQLFRFVEAYCSLKTNEVCSLVGAPIVDDLFSDQMVKEKEILTSYLTDKSEFPVTKILSKSHKELYHDPFYGLKKVFFGLITKLIF
ncbi:MAG: hypothetical protein GF308_14505 [Candidatus Heimdallarchaeota archaeon]|nr:hypothetical protein [Candidatus Heimdallarchaeota archaeon]